MTSKPALSSLLSGELLERADFALRNGEFPATLVEGKVSRYIVLLKRFVSFPGFPEIARHVCGGAKDIAQEAMRIASEICIFTNANFTFEEL